MKKATGNGRFNFASERFYIRRKTGNTGNFPYSYRKNPPFRLHQGLYRKRNLPLHRHRYKIRTIHSSSAAVFLFAFYFRESFFKICVVPAGRSAYVCVRCQLKLFRRKLRLGLRGENTEHGRPASAHLRGNRTERKKRLFDFQRR